MKACYVLQRKGGDYLYLDDFEDGYLVGYINNIDEALQINNRQKAENLASKLGQLKVIKID